MLFLRGGWAGAGAVPAAVFARGVPAAVFARGVPAAVFARGVPALSLIHISEPTRRA